jgi:hypothetical protein
MIKQLLEPPSGKPRYDKLGRMVHFGLPIADSRMINPQLGTWCFAERYFQVDEDAIKRGERPMQPPCDGFPENGIPVPKDGYMTCTLVPKGEWGIGHTKYNQLASSKST